MAEHTKVEWCDSSANWWEGCTEVSRAATGGGGCDNCYARRMNAWLKGSKNWGPGAPRRRINTATETVGRWQRGAHRFRAKHGRDRRVFVNSISDWLDNEVPAEWLAELLDTIRQCPDVTFLLLTKRIGNWQSRLQQAADWAEAAAGDRGADLHKWITAWLDGSAPANVYVGATVVNQVEADRDIPKLLAVPARIRFLSIEPLLGYIDLTREYLAAKLGSYPFKGMPTEHRTKLLDLLDWVIVGGESGADARPTHPSWVLSLRDQCAAAGVPFLFKQWGEWHTGAISTSTGQAVFRQFTDYQHWVNKADTWVQGGICLDERGRQLALGRDFMKARDDGTFPVTIMHRVGKRAAGRLLEGVEHNAFPKEEAFA